MSKGKLAGLMLLELILMMLIVDAVLFVSAGTWRYWEAWAYSGVFLVSSLAISFYLLVKDPELLKRRMKRQEKEKQQQVGQALLKVLFVLSLVVPGLDHRYGWSGVPDALVVFANAAVLAGFLIVLRVFQENQYAASTVEVEAGQTVISSGPYAVVRHPMYVGGLLILVFAPLALGSYWGLIISLLMCVGLVFRTKNEEAVLSRDLPGYEDYCRKVRWRLMPGVW